MVVQAYVEHGYDQGWVLLRRPVDSERARVVGGGVMVWVDDATHGNKWVEARHALDVCKPLVVQAYKRVKWHPLTWGIVLPVAYMAGRALASLIGW